MSKKSYSFNDKENYNDRKSKYNFGKTGRDWRSTLFDHRLDKQTRTLQFPLEHDVLPENIIDDARQTYSRVRGFDDSDVNLQRFINALVLSGFRFFGNASKAKLFANGHLEWGAIAFDKTAVYGSQNMMGSVLTSPMQMQIVYNHVKNTPYHSYDKDGNKNEKPVAVDKALTGDGDNALDNIFGATLQFWQNKDIPEIQQFYNIPNDKVYIIQPIKNIAIELQHDKFLTKTHYAKYKKVVGGNIRSWITNYSKRLEALKKVFDGDIQQELKKIENSSHTISSKNADLPENADLLKNIGIDEQQFFDFIQGLIHDIQHTRNALQRISSVTENNSLDEEDFEKVSVFSQSLSMLNGMVASINNNIDQYNKDNKLKDKNEIKPIANTKLKKLDKVPQFKGSILFDTETYKTKIENDFNKLLDAIKKHFDILNVNNNDVIDTLTERFSNQHPNTDIDTHFILKYLFHRFVGNMRTMSHKVKYEFIDFAYKNNWLKNKKHIRKYLLNSMGAFWKNPKSTSRHRAYDSLNCEQFALYKIEHFLQHYKTQIHTTSDYFEYLQLDFSYKSLCVSGLGGKFSSDIVKPRFKDIHLSPDLQSILNNPEVSSNTVQKVFNTYGSKLRGMIFTLSRKQFVDKITLRQAQDEFLYYMPKNKDWQLPNRIWLTDNALSRALHRLGVTDNAQTVDTHVLFAKIKADQKCYNHPDIRALLKQMPHDWGYHIKGAKYAKLSDMACKVQKGNLSFKQNIHLMRLMGPSTHKTVLDEYLIKSTFGFGTFEVVMHIFYTQKITHDIHTNTISVEISQQNTDLSLNVPVNEVFDNDTMDITKNCIAIDLGQYGIGYAVFDIESGELKKSGTKSIPSIRNVENRATRYRKTQSKKTHFKSNYNNKMEQVRKNAVGDVRNVINTLIHKHQAFPVFETSVDNLESGSRQLKVIYKSIINYYCFSDTDAHKTLRSQYWNIYDGKSKGKHKSIPSDIHIKKGIKWDDHYTKISEYDSVEELKLHPATRVNAAHTSQICYECNRCAKTYIDKNYKDNDTIQMDSKGRIHLRDGSIIRLYKQQNEQDYKKQLLQNMSDTYSTKHSIKFLREKRTKQGIDARLRRPMSESLGAKSYKKKDVLKEIKKNMRRPHISLQSKDTTQSRFFCVYEDCKNHQKLDEYGRINGVHADENAAKNIGKRFLQKIKK